MPELLFKNNRMSQADFASKLGVSEAFISQVISNKKYFSYPVAAQAAYILKCKMEELHDRRID